MRPQGLEMPRSSIFTDWLGPLLSSALTGCSRPQQVRHHGGEPVEAAEQTLVDLELEADQPIIGVVLTMLLAEAVRDAAVWLVHVHPEIRKRPAQMLSERATIAGLDRP